MLSIIVVFWSVVITNEPQTGYTNYSLAKPWQFDLFISNLTFLWTEAWLWEINCYFFLFLSHKRCHIFSNSKRNYLPSSHKNTLKIFHYETLLWTREKIILTILLLHQESIGSLINVIFWCFYEKDLDKKSCLFFITSLLYLVILLIQGRHFWLKPYLHVRNPINVKMRQLELIVFTGNIDLVRTKP